MEELHSFAPETNSTNHTNETKINRKGSKINEAIRYFAARNGLVAGSSPAAHMGKSPALDF
ncbi:hypothetical protein ABIB86_000785 [Bradyrhizobium sp. JR1.7]|uniref:hypothetical protein n=1 Tax=Bradyrhizobium sp. JR1.7 TaxID=3156368 RepID=UPI0033949754